MGEHAHTKAHTFTNTFTHSHLHSHIHSLTDTHKQSTTGIEGTLTQYVIFGAMGAHRHTHTHPCVPLKPLTALPDLTEILIVLKKTSA